MNIGNQEKASLLNYEWKSKWEVWTYEWICLKIFMNICICIYDTMMFWCRKISSRQKHKNTEPHRQLVYHFHYYFEWKPNHRHHMKYNNKTYNISSSSSHSQPPLAIYVNFYIRWHFCFCEYDTDTPNVIHK